jgi:hypothetical protein
MIPNGIVFHAVAPVSLTGSLAPTASVKALEGANAG